MTAFLISLSIVELFLLVWTVVRAKHTVDFHSENAKRAVAVAKDWREAYEGRCKMDSRPNRFWTWLVLIFCAAMLWIIFRRAQRSE